MLPEQEHIQLLEALGQYTDKLRAASRSYYERRSRFSIVGIIGILLTTVVLSFLFYFQRQTEIEGVSSNVLRSIVSIITFACATVSLLISFRSISDGNAVAQFEIMPIQTALRRLLNRASKLENHSIIDPDLRLIFDLKLAEAESALALSDWVLSFRTFSPISIFGSLIGKKL